MTADTGLAERLHAAMFGVRSPDPPDLVVHWLDRHLRATLGVGIDRIEFTAGAVGAVWAVALGDGRRVMVKALRPPVDLPRMAAVTRSQRVLAGRGFPCPAVLDGPIVTDGVVAVVEELRLVGAGSGDPHHDLDRAAMAVGLARQVALLADLDGEDLVAGAPAWSRWADGSARTGGLWPEPHDPVFDFTVAREHGWIDQLARQAAAVLLQPAVGRPVIGHSDWVWQNVAVRDGVLLAGYDWDSLAWVDEPAVVGLCAGAFSQGSPTSPDAPSRPEVEAFADDYDTARSVRFTRAERRRLDAAATWVRCYNARCQLDNLVRRSMTLPTGSFLDQLVAERRTASGDSAG